ncbi:MAG TPA: hypothetical protein VJ001_10850 [Rhodocyclaceae bacterium]|nr:hypothetical protein [Rhodocyclaceae bacterium]
MPQARAPRDEWSALRLRITLELSVAPSGETMARRGRALSSAASSSDTELTPPEDPVPFEAVRPGEPSRRMTAKPGKADDDLPEIGGLTWQLAPIRWGGNSMSSFSLSGADSGNSNQSLSNGLNVRASSYIVSPYIAQWTGGFGYSSSESVFSAPRTKTQRSDSNNFDYSASVNYLSRTRYPGSINFSQSIAQAAAGKGRAMQNSSMQLGARQSYRSESGDSYDASYNRSQADSATSRGVVNSFNGGFSASREIEEMSFFEGRHSMGGNVSFSDSTTDLSGQKSRLLAASANHSWRVHEDLSFSSTANWVMNQMTLLQGVKLNTNNANIFQVGSNFTWRPDEDVPLNLSGGGSFLQTQTEANKQLTQLQNLNGFVSANYRINKNMGASGGAMMSSTQSKNSQLFTLSDNLSLSYSGDPLSFGNFNYGWGGGGGFSHSLSQGGKTNQSSVGTSLSAQHSLSRVVMLGAADVLNLNASQSLSQSNSSAGSNTSFGNTAGASWRLNVSEELSGSMSVNASDSMSFGRNAQNHMRSATWTGNGKYQITGRAALVVSGNMSWSQDLSPKKPTAQDLNGLRLTVQPSNLTGSVSVGYSHRSPFSIPFLFYDANFMFTTSESNQQLSGVGVGSSANRQESFSLLQNVNYRLGRLAFRASIAVVEQNGKKNASVAGSMSREFGGF